jgi:acetolactate decarboxylase
MLEWHYNTFWEAIMKHKRMFLLALVGLFLIGGCSTQPVSSLTQVGTLQGLLAGEYDGTVALKELRALGKPYQIGLGTFDALDGEMVLLDGVCYRVPTTGHVTVMKPTDTTPFANVAEVPFDVDPVYYGSFDGDYAALKKFLLARIADPTRPYAIRIEGQFDSVKTRSVPRQAKPYKKLLAVVKDGQVVFDLENVSGTIVGFYFPKSFKGVNIVGFHLHFLTSDCSGGGHLLGLKGAEKGWGEIMIWATPLRKEIFWVGKVGKVRESSAEDLKAIEQGK